ncbi:MAG: hypothetical protein OXI59_22175 [Gemmatimonadota bacterium]|nr:hypothetical protein [Gemmatimonadota bacterium]
MTDDQRSNPEAPTGADPAEARKGRRRGAASTPHDKLFRAVFSDPAQAQALVRASVVDYGKVSFRTLP